MKFANSPKVIVLLDQALFSGTSFLCTVIIARMLDMETFGQYSGYLLGIYLAVSGIGAFVIQPLQVLVGQTTNLKQYLTFAFWLQVLAVLIFVALIFVIAFVIQANIPFSALLFAAGFLLHDFGRRVLLATNRPKSTLLLDAISTLGLSAALFIFYLDHQKDLSSLFSYVAIPYLLSSLLLFWQIKPIYFENAVLVSSFRLHVIEGKWLFLTAITQWWSSNLFVVASGIYLGAAALGALRLAQSLMGVLNVLLQSFENYILPQTAAIINTDVHQGMAYLTNASRKAGMLFLPVLAVTLIFSQQIFVLVGGKEYASYAYLLQAITLLYVLVFISQPIRLLIRALRLNRHFFYGYLFSLTFALVFSHALLSNFGLSGVLIGLAASQLLLIAYWVYILLNRNLQLWKSFTSF
ncbi:oligosaccharide flippase family protein [Cognataquiflexum rubidum]|uniref:oligosaccharide flippase family protein n=1 Tax=Cognataquiflexum rubidum TaxID=2922273 RepID=UPI001F1496F2|nr:oligosaccharide flippase family protein [Cognataquiflexum rubidum]MCH6234481.1 oligosaccharide flippase family protein [Cognataquiflexum rubidum]